jgi:hypothetical protein
LSTTGGEVIQEQTIAPTGYLNKKTPSNDIIGIPSSIRITPSDVRFGHRLVELIPAGAKANIPINCKKNFGVDQDNPDTEKMKVFLAPCGGHSQMHGDYCPRPPGGVKGSHS